MAPGTKIEQEPTRDSARARHHMSADLGAEIADELRSLEHLDLAALRGRWLDLKGQLAPPAFRRDMLRKALAYELQVERFGGLSPAMNRRLRHLAEAARQDCFDEELGVSSLKPGTVLVRLWQNQSHRVTVVPGGYLWNSETCGSLSTIAKTITGTSWNGWKFFGIRKRTSRNKNAAKRRSADSRRETADA